MSTPAFSTPAGFHGTVLRSAGRSACATVRKPNRHASVRMMADEKKNPLGGLGGLGNIMDAMKKAQEFSSSAKDLQDELKETEIEATVRDGAVKITMTGQQHPIEVVVSDELAQQGGEEVSKAVTECLIAAHSKVCLGFSSIPCVRQQARRMRSQRLVVTEERRTACARSRARVKEGVSDLICANV